MQKHVCQFEISVNDVLFFESLEPVKKLKEDINNLRFRQSFVFNNTKEISSIAVLHDKINVVGSFFDVIKTNNIAVVGAL